MYFKNKKIFSIILLTTSLSFADYSSHVSADHAINNFKTDNIPQELEEEFRITHSTLERVGNVGNWKWDAELTWYKKDGNVTKRLMIEIDDNDELKSLLKDYETIKITLKLNRTWEDYSNYTFKSRCILKKRNGKEFEADLKIKNKKLLAINLLDKSDCNCYKNCTGLERSSMKIKFAPTNQEELPIYFKLIAYCDDDSNRATELRIDEDGNPFLFIAAGSYETLQNFKKGPWKKIEFLVGTPKGDGIEWVEKGMDFSDFIYNDEFIIGDELLSFREDKNKILVSNDLQSSQSQKISYIANGNLYPNEILRSSKRTISFGNNSPEKIRDLKIGDNYCTIQENSDGERIIKKNIQEKIVIIDLNTTQGGSNRKDREEFIDSIQDLFNGTYNTNVHIYTYANITPLYYDTETKQFSNFNVDTIYSNDPNFEEITEENRDAWIKYMRDKGSSIDIQYTRDNLWILNTIKEDSELIAGSTEVKEDINKKDYFNPFIKNTVPQIEAEFGEESIIYYVTYFPPSKPNIKFPDRIKVMHVLEIGENLKSQILFD